MMAIAEENAGYGDRSASVRRRSAKFSITALVMHLPIHLRILCPRVAAALIQVKGQLFCGVILESSQAICDYPDRASIRTGHPPATSSPRPGRNAAAFQLAVVVAASLPPRRHNAVSDCTRTAVGFDMGDIKISED